MCVKNQNFIYYEREGVLFCKGNEVTQPTMYTTIERLNSI